MRCITVVFFIFQTWFSFAQCPETNPHCLATTYWYFGDSCGINFTLNGEVEEINSSINSIEGVSSYYEFLDSIVLYSNGIELLSNVYNHSTLYISGNKSSIQGCIIDKIKLNNYSLFTTDALGNKFGAIQYSILKSDSNFSLTSENKLLDKTCERMAMINHQDNYKKWIGLQKFKTNELYFFLIDGNNKTICPSISQGFKWLGNSATDAQNSIKFSHNSKFIAATYFDNFVTVNSFDNETGRLGNYFSINNDFILPYNIDFSSNDSVLIVSTKTKLFALNLNENDLKEKKARLKELTNSDKIRIAGIQLAPNGEVYVSAVETNYLGQIINANSFKDCQYKDSAIILKKGTVKYGLPNFNQSYFYTPSIDFAYKEDCINHIYAFEGRDTFAAQSHTWQFTKGNKKTIVNGKNINHQFLDTGIWQVQYVASNNQRSDTVVKNLTIAPKWQNNPLGADTFVCPNQNLILRTPPNMHCIHWQGQEPNLDTAMGAILDYDHFHQDTFVVTQKGVYSVKLTNKTFCQMWDSVAVSQAPSAEKPQISFATKELASTTKANRYRWFFNDTLLAETQNRSILPTKSGYYQLQIISEFGCQSPKSDSFFVDLSSIENLATFSFEVYPNPTNGLITLQVPQDALYKLFVYDISGKIISTQNITKTQTELNLSHLAKGVYIFKLQNRNEVVASRSVVIR